MGPFEIIKVSTKINSFFLYSLGRGVFSVLFSLSPFFSNSLFLCVSHNCYKTIDDLLYERLILLLGVGYHQVNHARCCKATLHSSRKRKWLLFCSRKSILNRRNDLLLCGEFIVILRMRRSDHSDRVFGRQQRSSRDIFDSEKFGSRSKRGKVAAFTISRRNFHVCFV